MIGGDLSNEVPRRVLVTYDYVTYDVPSPKKLLGVVIGTTHRRAVSSPTLNLLSSFQSRVDARLELVCFETDDDGADGILAELDRRSWQPFNYARGYASPYALVSDLPYRPEVLGVIDIGERAGMYGSHAISMDYLARVI